MYLTARLSRYMTLAIVQLGHLRSFVCRIAPAWPEDTIKNREPSALKLIGQGRLKKFRKRREMSETPRQKKYN